MFQKPSLAFLGVFIVNYFIMGFTRYIPGLPAGIIVDMMLLLTLGVAFSRTMDGFIHWDDAKRPITCLTIIWLSYCVLSLLNPDASITRWSTGIRGIAVYLFVFPLLTLVLLNRYAYLKFTLLTWSLLSLTAVLKAFLQKNYGFDIAETIWLSEVGARTHVIYSGTRYFSFFTDAASFGSSMALSLVVFVICAIYLKNNFLKFYFLLVSIAAGYGMMISGTRAAIIIPFVGAVVFVILSKQWQIAVPTLALIVAAYIFFNFTYIGHGSAEIRRMRSAFTIEKDASFNVRMENQKKMRTFMKHKPFGVGIGNAKHVEEGTYMYKLPTDSSLVFIWVETGIVGLILFLLLFLFVLAKGSYDVLFEIRNRELKGILSALLAGLAGMLVCSYGNEVLQQFPNGPILYVSMAFIFLGKKFDTEINDGKST